MSSEINIFSNKETNNKINYKWGFLPFSDINDYEDYITKDNILAKGGRKTVYDLGDYVLAVADDYRGEEENINQYIIWDLLKDSKYSKYLCPVIDISDNYICIMSPKCSPLDDSSPMVPDSICEKISDIFYQSLDIAELFLECNQGILEGNSVLVDYGAMYGDTNLYLYFSDTIDKSIKIYYDSVLTRDNLLRIGTSRAVFKLSDYQVIKIPLNDNGVIQNNKELEEYGNSKYKDLLAKTFCQIDGVNIQEYMEPLGMDCDITCSDRFSSLGIDEELLKSYTNSVSGSYLGDIFNGFNWGKIGDTCKLVDYGYSDSLNDNLTDKYLNKYSEDDIEELVDILRNRYV